MEFVGPSRGPSSRKDTDMISIVSTIAASVAAAGIGIAGMATASPTAAPAGPEPVASVAQSDDSADGGFRPLRPRHVARWWFDLTDEQRSCMKEADVTRSVWPMSPQQRRQFRADIREAMSACGVEPPAPRRVGKLWRGLTDEQRACLSEHEITRPALRRLTPDERREVLAEIRDAATSCGIDVPTAAGTSN